jgi:hypothetical protein
MMHGQRNVKIYNTKFGKFQTDGSYEEQAPDLAHDEKGIFVMCL